MRAFSASELLDVWERGQSQHPLDRAITLLAASCPEKSSQELVKLSLGQRDTLLFRLRQLIIGPHLETYSACPACGMELELVINIKDLLDNTVGPEKTEWVESLGEYSIDFRLPDSAFLADCLNSGVSPGSEALLKRCVLRITRNGENIDFEEIKGKISDELIARMAQIDPLSEVQITSTCSSCSHHWTQTLDILSFFWTELGIQVNRLMDQVHTLARAYGWRESEILSLGQWRRQYYLDRVTA